MKERHLHAVPDPEPGDPYPLVPDGHTVIIPRVDRELEQRLLEFAEGML
jgi:hypothetical protein